MKMHFVFYVLNYNANTKKVEHFNIFQNELVSRFTECALMEYFFSPEKYKHSKWVGADVPEEVTYGFKALCREIEGVIRWQMWARRQYEISVGDAFETDISKLEKWDCYGQALPNIEIITRELLFQYKKQLKEGKNANSGVE